MENYPFVNWVNGMKINKDTFLTMENALMNRINWSRAYRMSAIDYGLFSLTDDGSIDIDLQLTGRNTVEVTIKKLTAVTRGGALIHIGAGGAEEVKLIYTMTEDMSTDKSYSVVVGIDPFSRYAVGEADPAEEPPRQPYVTNEFTVSLLPLEANSNLNLGAFHLPVGHVNVKDGTPFLDHSYIPPSMTMQAHPALKHFYNDFERMFNDMESYSIIIMNKIMARNQMNLLSEIVNEICVAIATYTNQNLAEVKRSVKYGKPIRMVEILAGLGSAIKRVIDVRQNCGKEEVINYIADWRDLNQARFEQALAQLIVVEYDHTNCREAFSRCNDIMELLSHLFKKMSELDYIGDQQDASVFVKEENESEEEVSKRRRRFF